MPPSDTDARAARLHSRSPGHHHFARWRPLPVDQLHSTDRDRDHDARPAGWRAAFRDVGDEVEASGGTRSSLADSGVAGEGDRAWAGCETMASPMS